MRERGGDDEISQRAATTTARVNQLVLPPHTTHSTRAHAYNMVGIPSFKVERWMDTWEQRVQHDLAETCSDSISLAKLVELSKEDGAASLEQSDFFNQRCGYGHIDGSPELRGNIAKLYQDAAISAEDVLITVRRQADGSSNAWVARLTR